MWMESHAVLARRWCSLLLSRVGVTGIARVLVTSVWVLRRRCMKVARNCPVTVVTRLSEEPRTCFALAREKQAECKLPDTVDLCGAPTGMILWCLSLAALGQRACTVACEILLLDFCALTSDRQPGDMMPLRLHEHHSKLFLWTHRKAGAPRSIPSYAVSTQPRNAALAASAQALLQVVRWVSIDAADSFRGALKEASGTHKSRLEPSSTGE